MTVTEYCITRVKRAQFHAHPALTMSCQAPIFISILYLAVKQEMP